MLDTRYLMRRLCSEAGCAVKKRYHAVGVAGWRVDDGVSNPQSPVSSIWMTDTVDIIYPAQTQQKNLMPIP